MDYDEVPRLIRKGVFPVGIDAGMEWVFVNDLTELKTGDWVTISITPNNQLGQSYYFIGKYSEVGNNLVFDDLSTSENINELYNYGDNIIIKVLRPDIDLGGITNKLRRRQSGERVSFESKPDFFSNKKRRIRFGSFGSFGRFQNLNRLINYVKNC
jgi:hypothetical protein